MSTNVWTFDPGQTTGWSLWSKGTLRKWGVFQPEEVHKFLTKVLQPASTEDNVKTIFLYERLVVRQLSFNPIGMEVIGALKYIACVNKYNVLHQEPAQISGVMKWPIYDFKKKGLSEHEKDAIAHGIIYYRKLGMEIYLPPQFIIKE